MLAETPQLIPMVSWGVFFWSFPGKEFDLDGEAAVNAKPHSDKDAAALALAPGRSESSDPKVGLEQVASKELSERGVDRSQGPLAKASGTDFERRQKASEPTNLTASSAFSSRPGMRPGAAPRRPKRRGAVFLSLAPIN